MNLLGVIIKSLETGYKETYILEQKKVKTKHLAISRSTCICFRDELSIVNFSRPVLTINVCTIQLHFTSFFNYTLRLCSTAYFATEIDAV